MNVGLSSLKKRLTNQAVSDPLFQRALEDAADEIVELSRSAINEATIESIFERTLYATLKEIGMKFHPEKESPIATKRHITQGRADSRIGALIIEFKQPSTLATVQHRQKAEQQIMNYLDAESAKVDSPLVGYITDGSEIAEFRSSQGTTVRVGGFCRLDADALQRIVDTLVSLEKSALTPANLIRDFSESKTSGTIFKVARSLYKIIARRSTKKTEMLRTEWEALFRLSHDDQSQQKKIEARREALAEVFRFSISDATSEYLALFSLHTSYAIILKLISYRIVSDVRFGAVIQDFEGLTVAKAPVLQAFMASLEDGEIFRQIGIINLLEGDFFSWYADEKQWNNEIAEDVREILGIIARYEDSRNIFTSVNAVDLFRSLYEASVPQAVRSSLGEFYTPSWLAENVLEAAASPGRWTALDPCCGSGTFLISAIGKIRAESGKKGNELVEEIVSRVVGIDLNPLAVLTARVNYFINIADLIPRKHGDIFLPVFLGDSSNVPKVTLGGSVRFIEYELHTLKSSIEIRVPLTLTDDIPAFFKLMYAFEASVKTSDYDGAKALLIRAGRLPTRLKAVDEALEDLADQIIELERQEWNGIWARIVANFVATARLGKFSRVIGNPPWIDWKSLPSRYRDRVKGLCIEKGLFSGDGKTGGINLNICALVSHVVATTWLAPRGKLAFLMPKELANQSSYEGWRRSVGGARCHLICFDDWSDAGHPFDPVKEDFMTFIFQDGATASAIVPVTSYSKKDRRSKASKWLTNEEALTALEVSRGVAGQIITGKSTYTFASSRAELARFKRVAGYCHYLGREGIEFYPQELLLFRYRSKGPRSGTAWFENIQIQKSKFKIPRQRVLLETRYMFPLIKGPDIEAMSVNSGSIFVPFPYRASSPKAPLNEEELKTLSPLLLVYFRKFRRILEEQTSYSDEIRGEGAFYGLARTGPYSFKSLYVVFRDNSKWRCSVAGKRSVPWGGAKRVLFQNHAVSMCERDDRTFMSADEIYFVAGIFNCPIVERFIYASSDNRSFRIRPPVKVPLFDSGNSHHREIAKLARKLDKRPLDGAILHNLEEEYLKICG